ncbi:MAG: ChaB family protein [Candidatus Hodarchaeales archaeon]|jgi:cation transport regulator ChaB
MPYSYPNDVPAQIKNLPAGAQKIWVSTFNSVVRDGGSEDSARQAAWRNVKSKYKKEGNTWVKKYINQINSKLEKCQMKKFKNTTKDKGFFKTFIPLDAAGDGGSFIVEKEDNGVKTKYLVGAASDLKTDREEERVGKKFLEKMKSSAMGLTVFAEHEHTLEKTLGFISDVGGEETFIAETALEPEDENELVKSIISKLTHGTKLGYSIGGRVTEVGKVFDPDLNKDIKELLDGELYEVSVVAMPASKGSWVTPIFKSLEEIPTEELDDEGIENDNEEELTEIGFINKCFECDSETDLESHRKKFNISIKQVNTLVSMKEAGIEDESILTAFKAFTKFNESQTKQAVAGNLMLAWSAAREITTKSNKKLDGHIDDQRKRMGLTTGQMDVISKRFIEGSMKNYELEDMIENFQKVNEFIYSGVGEKRNFLELIKILDEMSETDSINDQLYNLFWTFRGAIYRVMYDDDMEPASKKDNINKISEEFSTKVESLSTQLANLTAEVEEQLAA